MKYLVDIVYFVIILVHDIFLLYERVSKVFHL